MIKLFDNGAYLLHGTELVEDNAEAGAVLASKLGSAPSKEEASKNTLAYGILAKHNTSDNMENLKIKFDKMTSHDITFVGIIQTARASGLKEFPIPYVLTNCHNSLCAVGGTSSGGHPSVCKRDAGRVWRHDTWIRLTYTLRCSWYYGYWRGRR